MNALPIEVKFWRKVHKTDSCWNWTGGLYQNGYGEFMVRPRMLRGAHRISWQIHNGNIPEGMWVLHKCDNRRCVNPKHLFLGNRTDNMRDMVSKGRSARGEKSGHAKLSEADVRKIFRLNRTMTQIQIAKRFHMAQSYISKILRRGAWNHIAVGLEMVNHRACGERQRNSKLTEKIVRIIRASPENNTVLAKRFRVTPRLIGYVRIRKIWKHVQ